MEKRIGSFERHTKPVLNVMRNDFPTASVMFTVALHLFVRRLILLSVMVIIVDRSGQPECRYG